MVKRFKTINYLTILSIIVLFTFLLQIPVAFTQTPVQALTAGQGAPGAGSQTPPSPEPLPPANFTAEKVGAHHIKFTWDPVVQPAGKNVDRYYIVCKDVAETPGFGVVGKVRGTQTSFTWTGLEPGTTYYCGVGSEDISYCKSAAGNVYSDCQSAKDANHKIPGGIWASRWTPINGLAVTTKQKETEPLVVTEEVTKEIVLTSVPTGEEEPRFEEEQIVSVEDNVATGIKTGKLIGVFPVDTEIEVEIDKTTLKQKVHKPFWAFLIFGL